MGPRPASCDKKSVGLHTNRANSSYDRHLEAELEACVVHQEYGPEGGTALPSPNRNERQCGSYGQTVMEKKGEKASLAMRSELTRPRPARGSAPTATIRHPIPPLRSRPLDTRPSIFATSQTRRAARRPSVDLAPSECSTARAASEPHRTRRSVVPQTSSGPLSARRGRRKRSLRGSSGRKGPWRLQDVTALVQLYIAEALGSGRTPHKYCSWSPSHAAPAGRHP